MTPFAKAPLALLARTDLTATEKLITIVRADLERRGLPTTAVAVAKAAGLDERTVRRIEARKPDRLSGRQPDKMSGKTGQLVRSETGQNVRPAIDVIKPLRDRGRERDFPPLVAGATQGKEATTTAPALTPAQALAAKAVRPCPVAEWAAQVDQDLRHGRYTAEALAGYLAAVPAIACWPRELAADVVACADARRRQAEAEAWQKTLRAARSVGAAEAVHRDGTRAMLRFVDLDRGHLILERRPPHRGRPPAPIIIATPAARAEWTFRRLDPTLFPVED